MFKIEHMTCNFYIHLNGEAKAAVEQAEPTRQEVKAAVDSFVAGIVGADKAETIPTSEPAKFKRAVVFATTEPDEPLTINMEGFLGATEPTVADKPRHKQDPTKGWPVCPQCNVPKASHLFKDADGVKQLTCNRCRGTLKSQKAKPPSERKPSLGAPKEAPKPSPFVGTDNVMLSDGEIGALSRRDQICNDCKRNVDTYKEPYVGGICIDCTAPGLTHAAKAHFRRLQASIPQTNDVVSCAPGDDE